jgi:hypothetical protein
MPSGNEEVGVLVEGTSVGVGGVGIGVSVSDTDVGVGGKGVKVGVSVGSTGVLVGVFGGLSVTAATAGETASEGVAEETTNVSFASAVWVASIDNLTGSIAPL